MIIKSIAQAQKQLQPYVPLTAKLTGKDITLERMWPLLGAVGNPQNRLRAVHLAGTSGKTSTAYYIAALLQASGKGVGLSVSPNVLSVTERVQVNGQPISETEFCGELGEFLDLVQNNGQNPTYFELMTAFVIWVFDRKGLDYVVIETGLGGLHDATNVLQRSDKTCVITDIGFDHTEVLGASLASITQQKAGIIHDQNSVIMYKQSQTVMDVIGAAVVEKNAELHVVDAKPEPHNHLKGYQQRNWQLAFAVYEFMQTSDGLKRLSQEDLQHSQQVFIPGRMEVHNYNSKTLVLDGAHNSQKMQALVDTLRQIYPNVRPAVLVALKDGKDATDIIKILSKLSNRVIVTSFNAVQDLPVRSMDAQRLAKSFQQAGTNATVITDRSQALVQLTNGPEQVCVATGSLYLIGQLKAGLKFT